MPSAAKVTRAVATVAEAEFLEATEEYLGWCPDCRAFTRDSTEPDARQCNCPVCRRSNVVGAEDALMMGLIELA